MRHHLALLIALAMLALCGMPLPCGAEEPVAYWSKTSVRDPQFHALYGNVKMLQYIPQEPDVSTLYFKVYTTREIDEQLKRVNDELATKLIDEVEASRAANRAELVRLVNALPQRVLADVAAQTLKDAVIQELRLEIDGLQQRLAALERRNEP